MKPTSDNDRLICLATFPTLPEASIVKGMLEANGIPAILDNQIFGSLYPIGFNSIGGIPVMVFARDLDAARELLEEHSDTAE